MRRLWVAVALVAAAAGAAGHAQTALTEPQRVADLNQIAGFYSKNYAPYEWKRELFAFDLLRLNDWFQAIHKADDLDFQDVLVDYVASLRDAHSVATFPSNFVAEIPVRFDVYDGRVLIDAIEYAKPLVVLVDGFTASAGDMFAAVIQDNGRAPLFGMRTMGAGGSVRSFLAAAYTESTISIALSLMNRGRVIQTPDYPPSPYIENIGVRPDLVNEYMTRDNLMTGGTPFVQAFTAAIVGLIQGGGS